jgi:hypothetical protein
MTITQLACDICNAKVPLREILNGYDLTLLCETCWEKMLTEAGDE